MSTAPTIDEDVIVNLEAVMGDAVPCVICGAEAVWEFSMRCCGDYLFTCDGHHGHLIAHLEGMIGRPCACGKCLHKFGAVASIDQFVRVVRI